MSALAAAAGLSAGLGIYKTIKGNKQISDAEELAANNKFTKLAMPEQVKLATQLAEQNFTNGMPGTEAAKQMIGQNGANAFYSGSQGASSGGDLLDLAAKLNYGSNVATNDLAVQGAQYKANALGGYQRALNNEADWAAQLYNNNELQPYLRTANTASSMYGAGQQNKFSGLDQIGTAALGYVNGVNNSNGAMVSQPAQTATSTAFTTQPAQQTFGQSLGNPYLQGYQAPVQSSVNPTDIAASMAMAQAKMKRGY